jgi:hypothetical protein
LRPQGAFGVRQLAAAFKNLPIWPFFSDSHESGSKLPHSKSFACKKYAALGVPPAGCLISQFILGAGTQINCGIAFFRVHLYFLGFAIS